MTGDWRRFGFLSPDLQAIRQIATLDLGPASLGMAPVISLPAVSSNRIVRDGAGSVVGASNRYETRFGQPPSTSRTVAAKNGVRTRSPSVIGWRFMSRHIDYNPRVGLEVSSIVFVSTRWMMRSHAGVSMPHDRVAMPVRCQTMNPSNWPPKKLSAPTISTFPSPSHGPFVANKRSFQAELRASFSGMTLDIARAGRSR